MRYLTLIPLVLFYQVQAATYYVDPAGSDANDGSATGSAWANIPGTVGVAGAGWVQLTNGDMVVVKGGTTNNVRVSFNTNYWNGVAAFNSVILRSGHLHSPQWGTTRAVIDGENTRTAGFALGESSTVQGLTIDGFEVWNIAAGAAGAPWDGTTGSSAILVGSGNYAAPFLTIRRCWLHHIYRTVDNTGHGIEFRSSPNFIVTQNTVGPGIGTKGIETYLSPQGVVSNNFISGCGDHSLALSGSTNVDACNNVIYDIPSQVHESAYGIQVAQCAMCDVWNNLIYRPVPFTNSPGGGSYGDDWSMGIGMYSGGLSNRIVNNTIAFFGDYDNDGNSTAIRLHDNPASYTDTGLILQNNLVYSCWNVNGHAYFVTTNYSTYENVQYNCWYSPSNSMHADNTNQFSWRVYGGSNSYWSNTVAGAQVDLQVPWATYANNQQANPYLTGGNVPTGLNASWQPNENYFLLTASTPASIATTGNALSGDALHGWDHAAGKFQQDIRGISRSSWSMGAYEYFPLPVNLQVGTSRIGTGRL